MSSLSAADAAQRRNNGRQRTLLAGKLANVDATETLDCTIRNISDTGAMIETSSPQRLSGPLHLLQVKDGVAWDVEIVWRRGNRIGVRLGDRHDLKANTEVQLRALRAIWSQMALR
jgi:hypothetical protein